jgi:hypothetical protein
MEDPEGNERLDVSGRVVAGRKGLPGVPVSLGSGNKALSTVTDERGCFGFRGVAKGAHVVTPGGRGLVFTPASARVEVGPENASGLVFDVADEEPPRVTTLSLKDNKRVAGRVSVEAAAADNLGVDRIEFLVDGKPVGAVVQGASGKTVVDFTAVVPGQHTFGARAFDGAGNESEVLSRKVWVVKDTAGPKVRILKPRRALLARGTAEVEAGVTDNYGVETVRVLFDGKPVGAVLTAEPWRVTFDTSKTKRGPHEIWIEATDTSGNVTTKKYRVTVQ